MVKNSCRMEKEALILKRKALSDEHKNRIRVAV
jgi:hypothetical protein